jgi:diguanylate cyclase (GGDEF)-like protein/PAS domain S-box-containing protein
VEEDKDVGADAADPADLPARLAATEEALRLARSRNLRTFLLTRTVIIIVADGRLVEVNPAAVALLGYPDAETLVGTPFEEILHPEDRARTLAWLGHPGPEDDRSEPLEIRLVGLDGRLVDIELLALGIRHQGEVVIQLLVYDITERKHAVESLTYQALHDALTGLPNRLLFLDRVRQALARMGRAGTRAAVFLCDLDRFEVVNDSLGHRAGDELLVHAAARLRNALRPSDTVARFAGDVFVMLCEVSPEPGDTVVVARRLLAAISQPAFVDDQPFSFTASMGVAVATGRLTDPEDLIRDAAAAMTQAKNRGRGRFELFDESTRAKAIGRMQIETALRQAMDLDELRVYYQPILTCPGGELVGMEALVRWQHPQHGFLLPGSFIPVAEDSGLIVALGNWVLEETCRQANDWEILLPEDRPIYLSVNLSAHQLHDPGLVERVRDTLIPPGGGPRKVVLSLEVTETTLVRDTEQTVEVLERLDDLGIRIGIDDFGTGYSSLSYLKRFPVTSIKIDQSFIVGVDTDPDDRAIVNAVIQLALNLGLLVVAEGVERPEQFAALHQMGCDLVQGFLFGRPLPAEAMTALLTGTSGPITLAPDAGAPAPSA